jgi:O-antigen ligase
MAGFGIGLAALATVQLYTSRGRVFWLFDSGYSDSVLGPFVYRNNYAAFMELLLPLALVEAFENRHGGWFLAGSALMVASVIASGSRAGAVLVSVELLAVGAIWIYRCRGGRSSAASLLRLALLIVVLTAVGGWGLLWDRFQEKEPLELRRQYLEASLAMFRDRPWTGFGLGTWPNVYPAYAAVDNGMFANRAHNDWAEWASEGGVPFVVALILVAGGAVGRAFRSVWGIGLVSVCVHALVDYPFARLGQVAWWFTVLALVGSLPRQHHSDGADQDVQVDPE